MPLSTPDVAATLPGMGERTGDVIAGCKLGDVLGTGAIGTVYAARHGDSDQLVAIKLIHVDTKARPDFLERFQREARLCYQLNHPNIVTVHTWGEENGVHYVIMDLVDGSSLLQMIRHHWRLKWPIAAGIARQIADALHHVHQLDLVHRDVKPANILVGRDANAQLADLGLARQLVDAVDEVGGRRITLPGTAMGSPCYMAPEQINDTAGVTPSADIYSLGATLYHALTGRPPLVGEDPQEVLRLVLSQQPRRASEFVKDLPKALTDVVHACLSKDPAERPESAAAVRDALADALQGTVSSSQ